MFGVDKAIKAGYDALYTTAPDVLDKKMVELDKIIKERALDLANSTIEDVTIKSRRKREIEEKEKNIKNIIKNMAKLMIEENEEYIGKEISEEAKKEIDEGKEPKQIKTKAKKGA